MVGAVEQSQQSLADAGRATGATEKQVLPVRGLGHAMGALGAGLKANELSQEGHSGAASVGGAAAGATVGWAYTAGGVIIGEAIFPAGGGIIGGVIGFGIDLYTEPSDAAASNTANLIDDNLRN